eukprot:131264_1
MSFHIAYNIMSTIVCFSICYFQAIAALCHWNKYPWNSDTSLVLVVIFTIFIANLSCCIFGLLLTFAIPNCNICSWAGIVIQVLYSTSKLSTYLFYLQRAKLAQLFRQNIPNYYFNKIFPIIFFLIYLIFLLLFIFVPNARDIGHCEAINSNVPFVKHDTYYITQWCVLDTTHSRFYINSGLFIEISVILFFSYVFSSPFIDMLQPMNGNNDLKTKLLESDHDETNGLWHIDLDQKKNIFNSARIYKDENSMFIITKNGKNGKNINGIQTLKAQQSEIKKILIYNILFSLIGFIFSSLTMIVWPMNTKQFWFIPWTDYCVNSITTFLMLSRNRAAVSRFIKCCCCGCCRRKRKKIFMVKKKQNGKYKPKFDKFRKSIIPNSYDDDFSSTNNYYHHITEKTSTNNSINRDSSLTL